jgi:hypothetical protein
MHGKQPAELAKPIVGAGTSAFLFLQVLQGDAMSADTSGNSLSAHRNNVDAWERAKSVSSIASAVVIPVVLLWVGNSFTSAIKERELQGKFVELAVQILREEPEKQALGLRDWATQVLDKYSGIPFSNETKKALVERTPLPSGAARYEGRKELGNTEQGDGLRFIGRGYLQIVGRANYARYSQSLGIDLLLHPEQAEQPQVAANILALWFKQRQEKYIEILSADDQAGARRLTNGNGNNQAAVVERYRVYVAALEGDNPGVAVLSISGISNPDWLSIHVPALLAALREQKVENKLVQAYALATAEFETVQGRLMKERG